MLTENLTTGRCGYLILHSVQIGRHLLLLHMGAGAGDIRGRSASSDQMSSMLSHCTFYALREDSALWERLHSLIFVSHLLPQRINQADLESPSDELSNTPKARRWLAWFHCRKYWRHMQLHCHINLRARHYPK